MEPMSENASEEQPSTFLRADEVDEAGPDPVPPGSSEPLRTDEERISPIEPGQTYAPDGAETISFPARPKLRKGNWTLPPRQPPPPAPPQDVNVVVNPTDSLSLSQLRRIVTDLPKPELTPYAFEYEDCHTFEEEIEELFGYGKEDQQALGRVLSVFSRKWQAFLTAERKTDFVSSKAYEEAQIEWFTSNEQERKHFIEELGRELVQDRKDSAAALDALAYILLGCYYESANESESDAIKHPDAVKLNAAHVYKVIPLSQFNIALHRVWNRSIEAKNEYNHDTVNDNDVTARGNSQEELWSMFTVLYIVVDFAYRHAKETTSFDENAEKGKDRSELLSSLTNILASYRWADTSNLPTKKLLLLFWKTTLFSFGGLSDLRSMKARLDPVSNYDEKNTITASPLDYHLFRQEISSKYPAFVPPPPLFPFEPNSNTMIPHLHENSFTDVQSNSASFGLDSATISNRGSSILHQPVHIATPAPSPPPSPAGPGGKGMKKQNYQTNQNFPFLYPPLGESSNDLGGKGSTELQDVLVGRKWHGSDIPTSILEAADLFAKRMRATRAMKQLWEERVRFLKFERGYENNLKPQSFLSNGELLDNDGEPTKVDGSSSPKAHDLARLETVERFYEQNVAQLQSVVVVLLKVLLQIVTTIVTQPNTANMAQKGLHVSDFQSEPASRDNGIQEGNMDSSHDEHASSPGGDSMLRDLDTMRSHEIMAKAVSGSVLLLLKWFKVSHILKAEYLTQLLLDSNYIQLILKLLTHQEIERIVNIKTERQKSNFFALCRTKYSRAGTRPKDPAGPSDSAPPRIARHRPNFSSDDSPVIAHQPPPEVDELGYPIGEPPQSPITIYSWRNFFSNINHLRTVQKIVKGKAHRQLLMVQYKYSNVLKRSLKVPQPDMRLYTLKIIKGQIPYCHRKWRSSNMRIITAIYLHCKPELRDDWLAGIDIDQEVGEALPLEQALRSLTYWYNLRRYPEAMTGQDAEKAQRLFEDEQDFFVRELERMGAVPGGGDNEPIAEPNPAVGFTEWPNIANSTRLDEVDTMSN